jgi:hypothetical protein
MTFDKPNYRHLVSQYTSSQKALVFSPNQAARGYIGDKKNVPKHWAGTAASYSTHEAATQPAT